jgi:hypothetical protein
VNSSLFHTIFDWIGENSKIKSAVLFGSSVSLLDGGSKVCSSSSDVDLHLVVSDSLAFDRVPFGLIFPNEGECFQAIRPATGGVRKLTLVFSTGEIDMVLVPVCTMRMAVVALSIGLYPKVPGVRLALNEMATCLHSGYRFLKGGPPWEKFYRRVSALPGVRLGNKEVTSLGNSAVCDVLWVLQKVAGGELIAAQHVLHSRVSDTNLKLWRELQLRNARQLPTFGLGRRVEAAADETYRRLLSVNAELDVCSLSSSTLKAFNGLTELMGELVPSWRVPDVIRSRIAGCVRPIFG